MKHRDGTLITDVMQTRTDVTSMSFGSVIIGGLFMYAIYKVCEMSTSKLDKRIEKLEKKIESK